MGASEDGFIRYYAGVALADRANGLRYGFGGDAMASKKRNRNLDVSTDGDVYLTVLRRSFMRTRTSTTPVWMGFGVMRKRWCAENGFFRSYALERWRTFWWMGFGEDSGETTGCKGRVRRDVRIKYYEKEEKREECRK